MSAPKKNGLYCAYLRKSRADVEEEARGAGETLARHDRMLRELAGRMGIVIARTFREIVSGDTIAERPEVRRLLASVSAGEWDGVLVMDVDRLGRGDSMDQGRIFQTFLFSSTLIITPDKIYDPSDDSDAEFFEIKLFFSRREYGMIKKRLQRGRLASAMDGCFQSARAPYGYERYKLPDRKGYSLRPVPEKAAIVRSIFEWYAYGMDSKPAASHMIARRLNESGLRTNLGNVFMPGQIRDILQNPVYIGKIRWNEAVTVRQMGPNGEHIRRRVRSDHPICVDGRHEPIIPMDLWNTVQQMFARHEKPPKATDRHIANPLAGLVYCKECGKSMLGHARDGVIYLVCRTQMCPTRASREDVVEQIVINQVAEWVADYEAAPDSDGIVDRRADREAREAALRQFRDQRATVQSQFDRLYDFLEQGLYTPDVFRTRRDELNARLASIDEHIAQLDQPDDTASLSDFIPKARTFLSAIAMATTPEEKNDLFRGVISRVVYEKTQRCRRNNKPGDYLRLTIYPAVESARLQPTTIPASPT